MDDKFRTQIACIFLDRILENEGLQRTDADAPDKKLDAREIADLLYTYTETVMQRFEPSKGTTYAPPNAKNPHLMELP